MLCLCVSSFTFAADPRPDILKFDLKKMENSTIYTKQLKSLANRIANEEQWRNNKECMEQLIKKGANPNVILDFGSLLYNGSPLAKASHYDDQSFSELLLNNGAKLYISELLSCIRSVAQVELLVKYGANVVSKDAKDFFGRTLLHYAAVGQKDSELLAYCCNLGLDPNVNDDDYQTPLFRLLVNANSNNSRMIEVGAKVLLLARADIDKNNGILRCEVTRDSRSRLRDGFCELDIKVRRRILAFHESLPVIQTERRKKLKDVVASCLMLPDISEIVTGYVELPGVTVKEVEEIEKMRSKQASCCIIL